MVDEGGPCPYRQKTLMIASLFLFIIIVSMMYISLYRKRFMKREVKRDMLEIEKTMKGDEIKITIRNESGMDLENAILEDIIPARCKLEPASTDGKRKGDKLTWDIGAIQAGRQIVKRYILRNVTRRPQYLNINFISEEPVKVDIKIG